MPILPSTLSLPWRATALAALTALSLPHAALAGTSDWKPSGDQFYRLEADGDLSCYSEDGVNCKPGKRADDETLIQPLVCGAAYKEQYGITGYDTAGHWCNDVYAIHFARWRDYSPIGLPVRMSETPNNDPMCWSYNGVDCDWGNPGEGPPLPTGGMLRPVVCGKAHQTHWKITGYESSTPDHWCQSDRIVASNLDLDLGLEMDIPRVTTFATDDTVIQRVRLPDWSSEKDFRLATKTWTIPGMQSVVGVVDSDRRGIHRTQNASVDGSRLALVLTKRAGKLDSTASAIRWDDTRQQMQVNPIPANLPWGEPWTSVGWPPATLEILYAGVPGNETVPKPEFVLSVKRERPRH